jgi:hypothetical protein
LLPRLLEVAPTALDRFELQIPSPLSTNQIACYRLASFGWCAKTDLIFTNGAAMQFMGTRVVGIRQPDFFFERTREKTHAKDFAGIWNMTEEEALLLARKRFRELVGQSELIPVEEEPESVLKPTLIGTNITIPRVMFIWTFRHEGTDVVKGNARVEVDTDKKRITSMSWGSVAYTNDPPVLDIPIMAPLPEGSGDVYLPPLGH